MESQIHFFRSDDIHSPIGEEGYIGGGSYGIVRYGFHQIHGIVAVKFSAMKGGIKRKNLLEKKIKSEIDTLQKANHENVVRIHGWTQWPGAIAIIMEFLPGGNLMEVLEDVDVILEPLLRLRMCYEISNGIAFLHNLFPNKRLVHGDIKAENILLTEDLHCKIADFGSAKMLSYTGGFTVTSSCEKSNQFTVLYASPEVIENPSIKLQPSHDTYSFGITVFMILGREIPVGAMNMLMYLEGIKCGSRPSMETILDFIQDLKKDSRSDDANVIIELSNLMQECWLQNPSDRPLMLGVKNALQKLLLECDPIKIQLHAVDAARQMDIKKLSRSQHQCVSLDQFSAPDFRYVADSSTSNQIGFTHDLFSISTNLSSDTSTSRHDFLKRASFQPYQEVDTLMLKSEVSVKSCGRDVLNKENVKDCDLEYRRITNDARYSDAHVNSDNIDSDYFECNTGRFGNEAFCHGRNNSDKVKRFVCAGRLLPVSSAKHISGSLEDDLFTGRKDEAASDRISVKDICRPDVVQNIILSDKQTFWSLLLWLMTIPRSFCCFLFSAWMKDPTLQYVCYQNPNSRRSCLLWKICPITFRRDDMNGWMSLNVGEAFKGIFSVRNETRCFLKIWCEDKTVDVEPAAVNVGILSVPDFYKQFCFFVENSNGQTKFFYEIRVETSVVEEGIFHLPCIASVDEEIGSSVKSNGSSQNITNHFSKSIFQGSAIGNRKAKQNQRRFRSSPKAFYSTLDDEESSET